jgi:hypothetical protein
MTAILVASFSIVRHHFHETFSNLHRSLAVELMPNDHPNYAGALNDRFKFLISNIGSPRLLASLLMRQQQRYTQASTR